jgi:hypothetical protein
MKPKKKSKTTTGIYYLVIQTYPKIKSNRVNGVIFRNRLGAVCSVIANNEAANPVAQFNIVKVKEVLR